MNIEKGDFVTRKSHNNDIIFKVISISEDTVYLKGVYDRLYADSDIFEWNENDFIYQNYRNEMNGTNANAENHFDELLEYFDNEIKAIEEANTKKLEKEYNE